MTASLRVLIATDAFPPKCGGSGWSTYYLARALQNRGHRVEVVQPKQGGRGIREREYGGVAVAEFGFSAVTLPGVRAWQRARVLETSFADYLVGRAKENDLLHAQHQLTIPPAVIAGRRAHRPVVSTVRDYWPVCLYGTLWRDGAACSVCRGRERTRCLEQRYGRLAMLSLPLLPLVERELVRRQEALAASDAVVAVSGFVAEKLSGVVDPARLCVVPNLIPIEELECAASRATKPSGEPYLLFVGKLNETKGAGWLPEIMRRVGAGATLKVVGDGELAAKLAGIPSIELCGWRSNDEALGLLKHARALLLPSRWPEPLSRVLLEAQALGAPTVALDTGGTRDVIEHEVNGLLANDLDGFAGQVRRVFADDALCTRLSDSARRIAFDRFSEGVVVERMEALYREVLAS